VQAMIWVIVHLNVPIRVPDQVRPIIVSGVQIQWPACPKLGVGTNAEPGVRIPVRREPSTPASGPLLVLGQSRAEALSSRLCLCRLCLHGGGCGARGLRSEIPATPSLGTAPVARRAAAIYPLAALEPAGGPGGTL
jgi:hypothetical protein